MNLADKSTTESGVSKAWEILVILLATLFWWPVLMFDFVWDDFFLVANNPLVVNGGSLAEYFGANVYGSAYFRPLVLLSLRLDYLLGNGDPLFFHLGNLLLNALSLIAFGLLLKKMGFGRLFRIAALLLWAFHPTRVEPIAFISARDNLMLASLALFSLWSFEGFIGCTKNVKAIKFGLLTLLFFTLALLVKEAAIMLPAVFLLRLYTVDNYDKNQLFIKKNILLFASSALFILIYFSLRSFALGGSGIEFWEGDKFLNTFAMPIYLYGYYIKLFFIPYPLIADSFNTLSFTAKNLHQILPSLVAVLSLLVVFGYYLKRHRVISFWIGWFLLLLLPYLNIVPISGRLNSDTWLILPSVGLLMAILELIRFHTKEYHFKQKNAIVLLLLVITLLPMTYISSRYLPAWENNEELYGDIVAKAPNNPRACFWLGNLYHEKGDTEKAHKLYNQGIQANPIYVDNYIGLAVSHVLSGDKKTGKHLLLKSLEIDPMHESTFYYLGLLAYEDADYDLAFSYATKKVKNLDFKNYRRLLLAYKSLEKVGKESEAARYLVEYCKHVVNAPICGQLD